MAVLLEAKGMARTIKDLATREVTVPQRVERVIAVGPGALRLVVYLGAADRIVGIEDLEKSMEKGCFVRPYAATLDNDFFKLPVVGTGGPNKCPDFERVMMCRPDIILTVSMDSLQAENMQFKTGVPVVCLSYGALGIWGEDAMTSLSLLGEILGCEQRADQLNCGIAAMQEDLKGRTQSVSQDTKPSSYFGGISFKGSQAITSTQSGYAPARMVNALNLADGLGKQGHLFIDREQLLAWDPNVIFIDAGSKSLVEKDFEDNRDFYRLLTAVRCNKVFSLLPFNYYNTNIELAMMNAYFIGKCLYPKGFEDVNIEEKSGQILNFFLKLRPHEKLPALRAIDFPEHGPIQWE